MGGFRRLRAATYFARGGKVGKTPSKGRGISNFPLPLATPSP